VLGPGATAPGTGTRRRREAAPTRSTPATCRSCGTELTTAAQRKVGRCDACPPTYDETTFEALRTWRVTVARASSVPAYVVFTDATLVAIAETRPASLAELAGISGVGVRKLEPTVLLSWTCSAAANRNLSPKTPLPQRNPTQSQPPAKRSHEPQ
jgi:DNA helicase-2/ATP-dependent DNA helicase PcrA